MIFFVNLSAIVCYSNGGVWCGVRFTLTQQHDNGDKFSRSPCMITWKMMKMTTAMAIKATTTAAAAVFVDKSRNANDHDDNTRKIYTLYTAVIYVLYLHLVGAIQWCGVDENDYFMKSYFSTDTYAHTHSIAFMLWYAIAET